MLGSQELQMLETDLFSRRFREGISFPDSVERGPSPSSVLSILLCRTEYFSRGEEGEKVPKKEEEEEGWQAKGAERRKDA